MSAIVILPWFPIDYSPLKEWDKIEARRWVIKSYLLSLSYLRRYDNIIRGVKSFLKIKLGMPPCGIFDC